MMTMPTPPLEAWKARPCATSDRRSSALNAPPIRFASPAHIVQSEDRGGQGRPRTPRHARHAAHHRTGLDELAEARSVAEIVMIEAHAAGVYWRSWRDLGLIERKGGNLPRSWRRFAQRNKGAEFLGNKHAAHPISAMINYCVVVEAGRLARALAGEGMALQIGFLHSDKHGRNSLVWDAIEPLRAKINANVFEFIACREFARADFPASGIKTHRIARPDHRRTVEAMSVAGSGHSRCGDMVAGFGYARWRASKRRRALWA